MVQLFSMILDFLDALAGAIAIACWWCTWVQPAKQPTRPGSSKRAEIDHFVCEAQTRVATATMPRSADRNERRCAADLNSCGAQGSHGLDTLPDQAGGAGAG
jgi:hypothetical protein